MYKNVASIVKPPPPPPMHKVFVYGTLKRGFHNHRLLTESRATFVATAKTRAPMRLVLGEYGIPYLMKEGDAAGRVPGELWEVDDAGLDALDVLEGVDEGMYERVVLGVEPADDAPGGTAPSAFGYVAGAESIARGVGGDACESIPAYDIETHEKAYVPKHERRAGSLGTRGR